MRLVAVSIVKNEADIIEAFVRHSATWVDHHLVFDHNSTDGTREILTALQREGVSLTLYTDDQLGNLQQQRSNALTRLAVDEQEADWVIPLDADEVLTGSEAGPSELRAALAQAGQDDPCSLNLWNYYATDSDDVRETNPIVRMRHCSKSVSQTVKVLIPRSLAVDPQVNAGKGSHQLFRDNEPLAVQSNLADFHLAHLAMRSPEHQVLRLVQAELQKLSRGKAHRYLDTHYRLGYQLLESDPSGFIEAAMIPSSTCREQLIQYDGSPLVHTTAVASGVRLGRALLPYLRDMALSHGELKDAVGEHPAAGESAEISEIRDDSHDSPTRDISCRGFVGFEVLAGLEADEGPVPEAFLPVFRWGLAPETRLLVTSPCEGIGKLRTAMLTYCDQQVVEISINGQAVHRHSFGQANQLENVTLEVMLNAGRNEITLKYPEFLSNEADPRKLAVLFLGLRVE